MKGTIGNYNFVKVSEYTIAVFNQDDEELPIASIRVERGIDDEKDFHYEIMDWYSKNIQ